MEAICHTAPSWPLPWRAASSALKRRSCPTAAGWETHSCGMPSMPECGHSRVTAHDVHITERSRSAANERGLCSEVNGSVHCKAHSEICCLNLCPASRIVYFTVSGKDFG